MGCRSTSPTASVKPLEASQLATDVIAAVRDQGVAQEDIQTSDYSIYPEYDYSGQSGAHRRYRVTNMLQVTVRDIDQSGAVIDAATAAGGDASQVGGVSLVIEDDAGLIQQARESAWQDATVKAEQLAELAGVTLGAPISITETTDSPPPAIPYADEAAAQEAARTSSNWAAERRGDGERRLLDRGLTPARELPSVRRGSNHPAKPMMFPLRSPSSPAPPRRWTTD